MATPCCSLDCQNVPHSLSHVLGVQVIAQRQGHHTNLDHLMGILGAWVRIRGGGGGGSVEPLDLVLDTLNWSTEANIAHRREADNRDPQIVAGNP